MAAARDSIPVTGARLTTSMSRGGLSSRGRGRSTSAAVERGRGRGRGKGTARKAKEDGGSSSSTARGRGKGSKRKQPATNPEPQQPATQPQQRDENDLYNIGPGSFYHLLFGEDQPTGSQPRVSDLNEFVSEDMTEEIQITQGAP